MKPVEIDAEHRKEVLATPVKQRQLSKSTHDQLTEIFKKIGTQSETNEVSVEHPEVFRKLL